MSIYDSYKRHELIAELESQDDYIRAKYEKEIKEEIRKVKILYRDLKKTLPKVDEFFEKEDRKRVGFGRLYIPFISPRLPLSIKIKEIQYILKRLEEELG